MIAASRAEMEIGEIVRIIPGAVTMRRFLVSSSESLAFIPASCNSAKDCGVYGRRIIGAVTMRRFLVISSELASTPAFCNPAHVCCTDGYGHTSWPASQQNGPAL